MNELSYPIGEFPLPQRTTPEERRQWIRQIARTPASMRAAVANLTGRQLSTPYRPGGWTVRQVIHHVPDSHLHAYTRLKFALTEDNPTIKPYDEKLWAALADSAGTPVEVSLSLLDALHKRWVRLLTSMSDADFRRGFTHPELGLVRLDQQLGLYAWHGRHHVAHITRLRERMGW